VQIVGLITYIFGMFSVHEILSTSTTEYVTNTLQSSSKQNWHSPSPTEDQYNSLPPSACSMQSSSKNPSTIRNWYAPVPANYPQKASKKKEKVVDSGSTLKLSRPTRIQLPSTGKMSIRFYV